MSDRLKQQAMKMLPNPKKNFYVFYFFKYNDWYKIGISLKIYDRLQAHGVMPGEKKLLYCRYCNKDIENVIMEKFKNNERWAHEWYKFSDDDVQEVIKIAARSTPSRYRTFGCTLYDAKYRMKLRQSMIHPKKRTFDHNGFEVKPATLNPRS